MRNRSVTLVDLGLDASFDASMSFVQSAIQSVNAGYDEPVVDVNFVRTRDVECIKAGLTTPSSVLHVMAHGDHSESPAFSSTDGKTVVTLKSLAETLLENKWGLEASTVIADGCKTGIGVWQRAVRDCLTGPITYVGTVSQIGWHESTVFCSAFYGALTRNKGRGRSPAEQGMDAAERAIAAYEQLTDRPCPFRAVTLSPSRQAKQSLLAQG